MSSKNQILSQIIQNSHATIVEIPRGYGFDFAKKQIDFENNAEILEVFPRLHDKQKTENINADDIEDLRGKLRGKSQKTQIVVFFGAEKMNETAQNKFLKLLEEPRNNLKFVLFSNSLESFLPTVRSRAQVFKIQPVSKEESLEILARHKIDEVKIRQIMFLAEGFPEEIEKLASDKKYFSSKIEQVEFAKKWISGNSFEKMIIINQLKNDREKSLDLIEQILKILKTTTNGKTAKNTTVSMKKLLEAYKKIQKNGNIKLNMLWLILA